MREPYGSLYSKKPQESLFARPLKALSRLFEKISFIQKSREGSRIPKRKLKGAKKIEPHYIRPPEKLPPQERVKAYFLGPDGKIKHYKGNPFKKRNR